MTLIMRIPDLLPVSEQVRATTSDEGKGKVGMSSNRHTEAHMIGALKQLEAGRKAEDVAREVGRQAHDLRLGGEYGGMDGERGAGRAKQLRDENTKLKKLAVDLSLDKEMLKALIAKNGWSW